MAYHGGPVLLGDVRERVPMIVVRKDTAGKRRLICRVCRARGIETVFYEDEIKAWERHASEVHDEADIEALRQDPRYGSIAGKAPHLFDPRVAGDVELGDWIAENREDIIAGRKLVSGRGSVSKARGRR